MQRGTKNNIITSVKFKTIVILLTALSFAVLFFAIRTALFFNASNYFSVLTSKQVFLSFLHGLRFDINVFSVFVMPFLILFALPFKNKTVAKVFLCLFVLDFMAISIFLVADIVFFSLFGNHIGVEILTSFTHFGLFAQMAFQTYWYATFPIIIVSAAAVWGLCRLADSISFENTGNFVRNSLILFLVLSFAAFFGMKGRLSFHGRPLGIIDSQLLGSAQTADLMLNGVFTAWDAVRHSKKRAIFNVLEDYKLPLSKNETVPDENYPFERVRTNFSIKNKNYNFVLIILESMDPILLGEYKEAAPNLNRIKDNSLYYKNFYSSGTRSLLGCGSTLFSMPYIWGVPTLNDGLAAKNLSRLAEYFKKEGYQTVNVITDTAMSDKAVKLASYMGFDSFYAKEDIPVRRKYPVFNKGFDYEGLEFFIDKIDSFDGKKFMGYFYTSSTHNPYEIVLSSEHARYKPDNVLNQFLNRVSYADDALGNFFRLAEIKPWFKDTVFIMLPDHRAPLPNREILPDLAEMYYGSYLLVYAPYIFKPEIINDIAVQEDILPTMLDMLNSSESYAAAGQSLFDKDRSPIKYIYSEKKETFVLTPAGNSWFKEPASHEAAQALNNEQKNALAFGEAAYKAMHGNRWKKKEP